MKQEQKNNKSYMHITNEQIKSQHREGVSNAIVTGGELYALKSADLD